MVTQRLLVICAALALGTSGCAAGKTGADGAPPGGWVRDERLDPWHQLGPSPTVSWVESALGEIVRYGWMYEECLFHLLPCGRLGSGYTLRVDDLTCTQVLETRDRCSFRLTETIAGEGGRPARSVRSRCTGIFSPAGTSHSPWQWVVHTHPDDPPMSCVRRR